MIHSEEKPICDGCDCSRLCYHDQASLGYLLHGDMGLLDYGSRTVKIDMHALAWESGFVSQVEAPQSISITMDRESIEGLVLLFAIVS